VPRAPVYASWGMLPLPMQDSLPAGWLAFAGRGLNPLDSVPRCKVSELLHLFPLPEFTLTLSAHDRRHDRTQSRAPFAAQPHPQLQAVCGVLEALARHGHRRRRSPLPVVRVVQGVTRSGQCLARCAACPQAQLGEGRDGWLMRTIPRWAPLITVLHAGKCSTLVGRDRGARRAHHRLSRRPDLQNSVASGRSFQFV
jgi:hypothetical protein